MYLDVCRMIGEGGTFTTADVSVLVLLTLNLFLALCVLLQAKWLLRSISWQISQFKSAPRQISQFESAPQESASMSSGLRLLRDRWLSDLCDLHEAAQFDPLFATKRRMRTLERYLIAEGGDVDRAALRVRETLGFRRKYAVMDFHQFGMARRLFMHGTNPGASMYFADYGLRDRSGEPVLVGRISLMTDQQAPGRKAADNPIPASHLRAGLFVIERAATSCSMNASYILDLGPFPVKELCTGKRYWDANGVVDDSAALAERRAPHLSVRPHLPWHETMAAGLPMLREALRLATLHYPELLHRVYFYKPGRVFRAIFAIFRLWVPPNTRKRFVLVNEGEESLHFASHGPRGVPREQLPTELGGTGFSLRGDEFLMDAVIAYDACYLRKREDLVCGPGKF
mmetsp:Transcript_43236/g.71912  ORF Transcript_43236/g.71912 Transcript_43236/m.71912 type:complete len:399 (+) Transcript_43236:303-1499(+)|eukprot:CAMPEP_0119329072 /NCGR_PEP_ID=MMETSP1333-20130426/74971_1 /TAXON_ID=418940 /ORGANISM="Scyphosphaera apsteinii, Strain RCC1455" /LENGTH=398 /DNA_ID=CAMNT_0007338097 /DNA_START=299 /DNA_END=1495 /DNA_ORIENTATION=+